jgi:sarcosine oxidase
MVRRRPPVASPRVADYDVIVVGLGAAGSATLRALAKSGASVLGIDRLDPPHALGSSHGDSRITRLAVGEGAQYGPLVARSHEIWRELEAETGEELLVPCGGLILGVADATGQHNVDDFVGSTIAYAQRDGVAHEVLDTTAMAQRFPALSLSTETGYFEPTAGYVNPEACVRAQLTSARRHGATVLTNETVYRWSTLGGPAVETNEGRYTAGAIVLAAGPWMPDLVEWFAPAFAVYRQVQYWFEIERGYDDLAALPVYIWMYGTIPGQFLYGFPAIDGPRGGVKIATEEYVGTVTPDDVKRTVSESDATSMFDSCVRGRFPGLSSRVVRSATCLYTVTPDFHFLVDEHPGVEGVLVVSACSGHGFKHSAAVGESVAQWALGRRPQCDLSSFSFARFDNSES